MKGTQPPTKCIIHGADKEGHFFIFAQRHGLYINVGGNYFWTDPTSNMMRRLLILLTISCTIKDGDDGGRLINNLGRTDTLTLYAQYSECGEWGGHQESIKIYRADNDELWTTYQRDTITTCEGPIENNRLALAPRTVKLTEDNQRAIIRYMHDLLDRSLEAEMPSHSGEYFSIRRNDSRLVISRTVHGYKAFDELVNSVMK